MTTPRHVGLDEDLVLVHPSGTLLTASPTHLRVRTLDGEVAAERPRTDTTTVRAGPASPDGRWLLLTATEYPHAVALLDLVDLRVRPLIEPAPRALRTPPRLCWHGDDEVWVAMGTMSDGPPPLTVTTELRRVSVHGDVISSVGLPVLGPAPVAARTFDGQLLMQTFVRASDGVHRGWATWSADGQSIARPELPIEMDVAVSRDGATLMTGGFDPLGHRRPIVLMDRSGAITRTTHAPVRADFAGDDGQRIALLDLDTDRASAWTVRLWDRTVRLWDRADEPARELGRLPHARRITYVGEHVVAWSATSWSVFPMR